MTAIKNNNNKKKMRTANHHWVAVMSLIVFGCASVKSNESVKTNPDVPRNLKQHFRGIFLYVAFCGSNS